MLDWKVDITFQDPVKGFCKEVEYKWDYRKVKK